MKNIGKTLFKIIKSRSGKEKLLVRYLEVTWEELCGASIAKHSRPHSLERGVLIIYTDNAAWSHNLLMMKIQLLERIKQKLKEDFLPSTGQYLQDILFHQGNLRAEKIGKIIEEPVKKQQVILTKEEQEKITKSTKIIQDENLKKSLQRLMENDLKHKSQVMNRENKFCKLCGILINNENELCNACGRKEKAETRKKIAAIIKAAPWLNYENCLNYCKCDKMLFSEIKTAIKEKAYLELAFLKEEPSLSDKTFLVLLETGQEPESISGEIIEKEFEVLWRKTHVHTSGRNIRYSRK